MTSNPEKHTRKLPWWVGGPIAVAMAVLGGFLSRLHGGGFISGVPKILKAFLWALPFSLCTLFAYFGETKILVSLGVAASVLLLCMVFKNTGHGRGMSLGEPMKEGSKPEVLEYLILWAQPKLPVYWYKFLILTVIGVFSVLPAVIAIGYINLFAGLLILCGGLVKPLSYGLGWLIFPKGQASTEYHDFFWEDLDEATAIGEFGTGVGAYAFLTLAATTLWLTA